MHTPAHRLRRGAVDGIVAVFAKRPVSTRRKNGPARFVGGAYCGRNQLASNVCHQLSV